mgnify:FL=1
MDSLGIIQDDDTINFSTMGREDEDTINFSTIDKEDDDTINYTNFTQEQTTERALNSIPGAETINDLMTDSNEGCIL